MEKRSVLRVAALGMVAAVLFGLGFFAGRRHHNPAAVQKEKLESTSRPRPASPEPAAPLASTAMKKAVLLSEQNPDAYRATYLNKRYRVVGKVQSVAEDETRYNRELQMIPLRRWGRDDDMAGLALMLVSRAGAGLTGTVVPLDGGASLISG